MPIGRRSRLRLEPIAAIVVLPMLLAMLIFVIWPIQIIIELCMMAFGHRRSRVRRRY